MLAGVIQHHSAPVGPDLRGKLVVVLLVMPPSFQKLEPPAKPGRFTLTVHPHLSTAFGVKSVTPHARRRAPGYSGIAVDLVKRDNTRLPCYWEASIRRNISIDDVLALHGFPTLGGHPFCIDGTGKYVAFALPQPSNYARRHFLSIMGGAEAVLHVIDLERSMTRKFSMPNNCGVVSPSWSPDGRRIAIGITDGTFLRPALVDVVDGQVRILSHRNLHLALPRPMFGWLGPTDLLCEFSPTNSVPGWMGFEQRTATASMTAWKRAWTGVTSTASCINLDSKATSREAPVYHHIDTRTGEHQEFVGEVLPDRVAAFARRPIIEYPLRCVGEGHAVPSESVRVAESPSNQIELYLARSDDATRLWSVDRNGPNVIFETDQHLREISGGQRIVLPFQTRGGKTGRLLCILPQQYNENEQRPALVWVYPGVLTDPDYIHRRHLINDPTRFNLHPIAAQGFIVLIPDIPADELTMGDGDMVDCLTDVVVPAIHVAIERGLVDSANIHVAGSSLGGWAALMLIAKTDLFKSGIAMAGLTNLISASGAIDVRLRFGDSVNDSLSFIQRLFHLKEPPWKAVGAYMRNSPLLYVNDIHAPVLLIHGDQDYVSINQAEEMYSALRSLGKEVELVRYWGEGHVFESPANVRDMWGRVISWLNAH